MLDRVEILCEVVCYVIRRFDVRYNKLALSYAIANPMESHVDGLGALLLDRIRSDADSTGIIAHDNSWRLRVAEVV